MKDQIDILTEELEAADAVAGTLADAVEALGTAHNAIDVALAHLEACSQDTLTLRVMLEKAFGLVEDVHVAADARATLADIAAAKAYDALEAERHNDETNEEKEK